ncbi:MAG: hypothetical protein CM15mP127_03750 [Gammaproteobacteria bacterium]|nr:MAG: hypothetical protein CM15mP127_03750 [Gammaproteobacteria bacterium]
MIFEYQKPEGVNIEGVEFQGIFQKRELEMNLVSKINRHRARSRTYNT